MLERGQSNRQTSETRANVNSSRSHTIFQVQVEIMHGVSGKYYRNKLNFCDLAGSEKLRNDESIMAPTVKMNSTQLKENKNINTSLTSLGKVILCLALGKKREHVPYRDSKLTRLLQDSLSSSDCQTTLIATVH